MPLQNDGDVVRGLGFVALYAAYLEEQVDNLLLIDLSRFLVANQAVSRGSILSASCLA